MYYWYFLINDNVVSFEEYFLWNCSNDAFIFVSLRTPYYLVSLVFGKKVIKLFFAFLKSVFHRCHLVVSISLPAISPVCAALFMFHESTSPFSVLLVENPLVLPLPSASLTLPVPLHLFLVKSPVTNFRRPLTSFLVSHVRHQLPISHGCHKLFISL